MFKKLGSCEENCKHITNNEECNSENRRRTIFYIKKKMKIKKRRILHECSFEFCNPINILKFITKHEAIYYEYDEDIYVCVYQQVHVCDNTCIGSILSKDGFNICPKTCKRKQRMYNYVEILQTGNNFRYPGYVQQGVPQRDEVIDGHRTTTMIKYLNHKLHLKYNPWIKKMQDNQEKLKSRFVTVPIKPKIIKKRNKKIVQKINKKDQNIPNFEQILDIFLMKKPINFISEKIPIYLTSLKLYTFARKYLINNNKQTRLFRLSTGCHRYIKILNKKKIDIKPFSHSSKTKIFNSTYLDIIKTSEDILEKILPGIFRFKKDFFKIESIQSKLYTKAIKYVSLCEKNKIMVNGFKLSNILQFDNNWKNRHDLGEWVTEDKWCYYLLVILRSYIFCERCGGLKQKRKCLGPLQHVLGVMYTLKHGYSKSKRIGNRVIDQTIIPQDKYLNTNGILLEENKLSSYIDSEARKSQKVGVSMFKGFLDYGTKLMTSMDLRNFIFP